MNKFLKDNWQIIILVYMTIIFVSNLIGIAYTVSLINMFGV